MSEIERIFPRAQAKSYAAVSALRQRIPQFYIPGLDSRHPNFRVTHWRAPKQFVDHMGWVTVNSQHPKSGSKPSHWQDAVFVGAIETEWRERTEKYGIGLQLAVAYRLGRTAFLAAEIPEDAIAGLGRLSEERADVGGIALRLGNGPLYAALGSQDPENGMFMSLSAAQIITTDPFPLTELQDRHPGAVLL